MTKKMWGLLFTFCIAAWHAECLAEAPGVRFKPPGPGINAPLDANAEGVGYGWKSLQTGSWAFDGDSASIDNTIGAVLRYWSTNQGNTAAGPAAAMSDTEDWVFEIVYRHTGPYTNEWPWFLKANATDERIVQLRHLGGSSNDSWALGAGLVAGGWAQIGDPFSLGSDFNKFTVHYKAATQTLDAYLNDVLIPGASGFTLEHGNYKADFVQLEWQRAGVDSFQSLKLGQLAPEPTATLMFSLAICCSTGLLGRRRR